MDLLPPELRSRLPPLLSQESAEEPLVYAKYCLPGTRWAWYVTEGEEDGDDFLFFGFVTGLEDEFGHFQLSEIKAIVGPSGQVVQRDLAFVEGLLTHVVPASRS